MKNYFDLYLYVLSGAGVVMGSSGCNSSVDVEAGLSRKLGQGHNLRTV